MSKPRDLDDHSEVALEPLSYEPIRNPSAVSQPPLGCFGVGLCIFQGPWFFFVLWHEIDPHWGPAWFDPVPRGVSRIAPLLIMFWPILLGFATSIAAIVRGRTRNNEGLGIVGVVLSVGVFYFTLKNIRW